MVVWFWCVCVCVCARARVCVCVCVRVWVTRFVCLCRKGVGISAVHRPGADSHARAYARVRFRHVLGAEFVAGEAIALLWTQCQGVAGVRPVRCGVQLVAGPMTKYLFVGVGPTVTPVCSDMLVDSCVITLFGVIWGMQTRTHVCLPGCGASVDEGPSVGTRHALPCLRGRL